LNIYDKLNELTRAIAVSDAYKNYSSAALKVDQNETHASMLNDFLTAQMQISSSKMLGQEPTDEMIANFNSMYSAISSISAIREFLEAQSVFSTILDDIYKEIGKAVDVKVSFFDIMPNMNFDD
jgi:cell fate (sporulation/competence/biofilm development) regulator YlbF (YheA/YmcA/DUF963 family)